MRKRTFINALLFGALIVAPASTFVSCSDYDDDIAGLRNDLDATKQDLQTLINEKISAVEQELTNLQNADDALLQAYKDADEALRLAYTQADEELRQQLEDAITAGDAATLAAARELVNSAKEELQKALDECKASCNEQFADQNEKIDALIAADVELSQAINDAKAKAEDAMTLATTANETANAALELANANKEDLAELKNLIAQQGSALQESVSALQTTVNTLQQQYSTLSEDLNELSQKVSENTSAIEAQEAALEAYKKTVEENFAEMSADLKAKYEENKGAIEQAQTDLAELEKALAAQKTELTNLINQEVAKVQENVDDLNTKVESIKAEHDTQIQALQTDVENLQADLKTAQDDLVALKDKLADEVNVLNLLIGQELRSLVFKPELYVDGVEAAEYGYMPYEVYTTKVKADNVNNQGGHVCSFPNDVLPGGPMSSREYDPVVNIQYHMNPSSATIDEGALSFISRDAEFITRANESGAAPQVANFDVANGMLTVGMTAKGSAIFSDAKDTEASIFALQAKVRRGEEGDTLITSDYAMLYASKITPQAIAFNANDLQATDCDANDPDAGVVRYDHLYKSLADVMGQPANFEVKFDSETGVDLTQYLEIHYNWDTKTKKAQNHASWKYGEEKAYGLSYKFDLVYYSVDGNKTSDSKYATLNDGVLKAATVDASGNTIPTQDRSSLGREPLVRVTVVNEQGEVVLYGFVKFKIVEHVENMVTDPFELAGGDINVCGDNSFNIAWSEVSNKILSKLNMSNEQFHNAYELVVTGSGADTEAVQFVYTGKGTPADGEAFEVAKTPVGKVVENKEEEATRTSSFTWTLSDAEQQAIYELKDHTTTIYIAYKPKDESAGKSKVYLPITITFNEKADAGAIVATKLNTYWQYGPNTNSAGMNVLQPEDGKNTKNWVTDVHQIWEGGKVSVPAEYEQDYGKNLRFYFRNSTFGKYTLVAAHDALVNATEKAYDKFTGTAYDPTAENERQHALDATKGVYTNNALFCNGELVATLDQEKGIITMNNNSDVAKEIVNAYGSYPKDAPQAFLNIGMYVFNDCKVVLPLTDDTKWFSEYILRPINVVGNAGDNAFIDAKDNGSKLNLADVLDFSDWRNQLFKNSNYSNVWYYAFYGIKSVTVDIPNILTNMNSADGSYRKLSDVAPDVKISQQPGSFATLPNYNALRHGNASTWAAIQRMFGTITYDNNGNPIGEGNILRLPITVEYDWGTLHTSVDIPIKTAYEQ